MLGAAVGFGAQQVVRDLLAGIFIVVERQYGYGDLVHISAVGFEGATGTIEEVALRTLTGDVVTVPNGEIVGVTNLSRDWARAVVDVPLRPLLLDAPTVMGVESFETATSTPETTSPSRSATSTSRPATTRGTAPTPTTAGATGTSAPSQTTVEP